MSSATRRISLEVSAIMGRRILIKGTSGAGKTTLAARVAACLGVPHIELDALQHGPNWRQASEAELRAAVAAALDPEGAWVADGNYDSKLGRLAIERAELVVWLDLPLGIALWRLAKRTSRRIALRETLWNGNRESLRDALGGWDALFPWAVRSHFRHRRDWPAQLAGVPLARLRSAHAVERWFAAFSAASAQVPVSRISREGSKP
jgi:hypothetical protein